MNWKKEEVFLFRVTVSLAWLVLNPSGRDVFPTEDNSIWWVHFSTTLTTAYLFQTSVSNTAECCLCCPPAKGWGMLWEGKMGLMDCHAGHMGWISTVWVTLKLLNQPAPPWPMCQNTTLRTICSAFTPNPCVSKMLLTEAWVMQALWNTWSLIITAGLKIKCFQCDDNSIMAC